MYILYAICNYSFNYHTKGSRGATHYIHKSIAKALLENRLHYLHTAFDQP